jgi:HSP20 family molecular chaperone IbpA
MQIPVRIAEDIVDEIQEMYEQITKRAYEIFLQRGGVCTLDLEDWLKAEQELLFKPEVHLDESECRIKVTVCIGKVRPVDIHVLVTPDAVVIQAEHTTAATKVFRAVEFPRRIDVNQAQATYENGCLIVTV